MSVDVPEKQGDQEDLRDPLVALERYFGFRKFLDGQAPVISALVSGRDALVVMPTGGGKSLCYQLPALVMDGVTIVVSPLIALMKDQVDALLRRGIAATMINSTISPAEQHERIAGMRAGEFKLVYIAPERFRSRAFTETLSEIEIALFAIDEAHCLSQWGHDFRPDYLKLGEALERIGKPQTAALTATATPEVRADILKTLRLRDPFETVSGFARPNLSLRITHIEKMAQKFTRIKDIIAEHKTGIVYCATRKHVDEVSETLFSWGVSTVAYHGGLRDEQRESAQNLFIKRERDVAVATNAFGMGIDRPDVRFVVHFDIPGSIEAYYQEAGRAGRDGEASTCELLFSYADTRTQEFFIDGANPPYGVIRDTYQQLLNLADANHEVRLPIRELAKFIETKNDMTVSSSLTILSRHRYIERFDIPGQRTRGTRLLQPSVLADQLEIDREALEEKDRRDRSKLKSMVELCYSQDCRQRCILEYFGEKDADPCGNCDQCLAGDVEDVRAPGDEERTIVRKALSGVARMSRRHSDGTWEGRFGRGRIVQMLVGSRSQEILNNRLDELSTYGILRAEGTAYLNALFRGMISAGLIVVTSGEYPLMTLTELGETVMRGNGAFRMKWPQRGPSMTSATSSALTGAPGALTSSSEETALEELGFDTDLFEKLKALRNELAKESGMPPYTVFNNKTLEFFTRLRPKTVLAGSRIRGVGEVKAEKYLPAFVELIASHEE